MSKGLGFIGTVLAAGIGTILSISVISVLMDLRDEDDCPEEGICDCDDCDCRDCDWHGHCIVEDECECRRQAAEAAAEERVRQDAQAAAELAAEKAAGIF